MKIQISNHSHQRAKRYSGVYQQQGRMITDADWNELVTIIKERQDSALEDVVGANGSPAVSGILRIGNPGASDMADQLDRLVFGNVYTEGILGEIREKQNPDPFPPDKWAEDLYVNQQDFAGPALPSFDLDPNPNPGDTKEFHLYVDVWERLITSLEDHNLLDPGLHGADTCARTQTLAQIKWCSPDTDPGDENVNPMQGNALFSLAINEPDLTLDPCGKDPADFDLATSNQLFRLEVHDVESDLNDPRQIEKLTLKWSTENAAETHAVDNVPPYFTQPAVAKAYEFFNDRTERQMGWHLALAYKPPRGKLRAAYPDAAALPENMDKVRRWDGYCILEKIGLNWNVTEKFGGNVTGGLNGAAIEISAGKLTVTLDLEGKLALAGDYWLARVREQQTVEAQRVQILSRTPVGIAHHYVPLGTIIRTYEGPDDFTDKLERPDVPTADSDAYIRRLSFPPLTDIPADHVGYDPVEKTDRWDRLDLGFPYNVQDAIDELVEGLQAKHIDYEIPDCGIGEASSRNSLLDVLDLPADGSVKVDQVLDALLCKLQNLPFHNKHLHGWGIVCGLQVHCGPDTASTNPGEAAQRRQVTIQKGYALDCEGRDIVLDAAIHPDLIEMIDAYEENAPKPILEKGNGTACLTLERRGGPVIGIEPYAPDDPPSIFEGTVWGDFFEECIKQPLKAVQKVIIDAPFDDDDPNALDLISPVKKRLATWLNLLGQLIWPEDGQYVFLSEKEHKDLESVYRALRHILQSKTFCGMYRGDEFPAYPFPGIGLSTIFGEGFHTRLRLHPSGRRAYTCGGDDGKIHVYDLGQETMVAALDMPAGAGASVKDVAFSRDGTRLYAIASLAGIDTIFGVADIDGAEHRWRPVTVLCDIELVTLANAPDDLFLYAIGFGDGLFVLNPDELLAGEMPRPNPIFAFNATGQMTIDDTWVYATAGVKGGPASSTYDRVVSMQPSTASGNNIQPDSDHTKELKLDGKKVTGDDDLVHAFSAEISGFPEKNRVYIVVDTPKGKFLIAYDVHDGSFGGSTTIPTVFVPLQDTIVRLGFHPRESKVLATIAEGFRMQVIDIHTSEVNVLRHPVQLVPVAVAVSDKPATYVLNGISNTISVIPDKFLLVTDQDFLDKLRAYRYQVLAAYSHLVGGLLQFLKDCFCDRLLVDCPTCDDATLYLACVEIKDRKVYRVCNFSRRKYVKSFPTMEYWLSVVPVIPLVKNWVGELCCSILPNYFDKFAGRYKPSASDVDLKPMVMAETVYEGVRTFKRTDFRGSIDGMKKSAGVYRQLGLDAVLGRVEASSKVGRGVGKNLYVGMPTKNVRESLEKRGITVKAIEPYDRAESGTRIADFLRVPPRLTSGTKVKIYERDGKVLFYAPIDTPSARGPVVTPEVVSELDALERRKAALSDMSEISAELGRVVEEVSSLRTTMTELEETRKRLAREIARGRPVRDISDVTPAIDDALRELRIRTVAELAGANADVLAADSDGIIALSEAERLIAIANKRIEEK